MGGGDPGLRHAARLPHGGTQVPPPGRATDARVRTGLGAARTRSSRQPNGAGRYPPHVTHEKTVWGAEPVNRRGGAGVQPVSSARTCGLCPLRPRS